MGRRLLLLCSFVLLFATSGEARVIFKGFTNHSSIQFEERFDDGYPYKQRIHEGILLDQEPTTLRSKNGSCAITFKDLGSTYLYGTWHYGIYVERERSFPFGAMDDGFLYATIYYNGDGEFELEISEDGKLTVIPGYDVQHVSYR